MPFIDYKYKYDYLNDLESHGPFIFEDPIALQPVVPTRARGFGFGFGFPPPLTTAVLAGASVVITLYTICALVPMMGKRKRRDLQTQFSPQKGLKMDQHMIYLLQYIELLEKEDCFMAVLCEFARSNSLFNDGEELELKDILGNRSKRSRKSKQQKILEAFLYATHVGLSKRILRKDMCPKIFSSCKWNPKILSDILQEIVARKLSSIRKSLKNENRPKLWM